MKTAERFAMEFSKTTIEKQESEIARLRASLEEAERVIEAAQVVVDESTPHMPPSLGAIERLRITLRRTPDKQNEPRT